MDAEKGYILYQEGKYSEASALLKKSFEEGDFRFLSNYADICHRNLDDLNHDPSEAAYFYLKAAQNGDGDILSYLASLSKDLVTNITDDNMPMKIEELVLVWNKKEK